MALFWVGFGIDLDCARQSHRLAHRRALSTCAGNTSTSSMRIFQERPLFVIPRGQPSAEAEDVSFPTVGGLRLRGCYSRTGKRRRGVILFGLEFGSDRWSCRAYCDHLIEAGFDVFAFEPRNQGESDPQPGYDPLQWVTEFEVQDTHAALEYLKNRPDADPRGIGFFGISKGGAAGLIAASRDRFVRCCVTDGIFGTYSTLVPYMRHYFRIYNNRLLVPGTDPIVVLRPDRPHRPASGGTQTPLPLPAPGETIAAPRTPAPVHDPRRSRHVHQARDGPGAVRLRAGAERVLARGRRQAQPSPAPGWRRISPPRSGVF